MLTLQLVKPAYILLQPFPMLSERRLSGISFLSALGRTNSSGKIAPRLQTMISISGSEVERWIDELDLQQENLQHFGFFPISSDCNDKFSS